MKQKSNRPLNKGKYGKNIGERDECLCKIKLISLRDKGNGKILRGEKIESVGFDEEYPTLSNEVNISRLNEYSDEELRTIADIHNISKSPPYAKADIYINKIPFSIKSNRGAPAAIVNTTRRDGFEFVAEQTDFDIKILDKLIDEYWLKRLNGEISQDIKNSDIKSPFRNSKNELKDVINFFFFDGTGSKLSSHPSKRILTFDNPLVLKTYNLYNKENLIDIVWDKLIFSLRGRYLMKRGYPGNMSKKLENKKASIALWTRFINNKYKGELHIRLNK